VRSDITDVAVGTVHNVCIVFTFENVVTIVVDTVATFVTVGTLAAVVTRHSCHYCHCCRISDASYQRPDIRRLISDLRDQTSGI